jgi:predicted N-formylglutamate amidohydrolase
MLHMTAADDLPLLDPDERPAAQVLNASGTGAAVLVCEHASRFIPGALNGLGLSRQAACSHAAWDIGALDLATRLSGMLDVPLVAARVSRLVYDCNRPPEADSSIPAKSEVFAVPGNIGLSEDQRAARVRDVYSPFCTLLGQVLEQSPAQPVMITIHSFTPVFNGQTRDVELGFLHDADDRMARNLLSEARQRTPLRAALNQPYSAADGVTHTLRTQAGPRGLANVMIEVRNDLIDTPEGVTRIAGHLTPILSDTIENFAAPAARKHKSLTGNGP